MGRCNRRPFLIAMDNFLVSEKWKRKRAKVLRRDGYMCQLSKRVGKMVSAEVVHHIFPRDEFPEYRLTDWNLISITKAYHNKLHDRCTNELTAEGRELLRRTARAHKVDIPEKYKL